VQAEEDNEPTLLMARATLFPNPTSPSFAEQIQAPSSPRLLRVIKEKVFV
jgi:hypothetical protein